MCRGVDGFAERLETVSLLICLLLPLNARAAGLSLRLLRRRIPLKADVLGEEAEDCEERRQCSTGRDLVQEVKAVERRLVIVIRIAVVWRRRTERARRPELGRVSVRCMEPWR